MRFIDELYELYRGHLTRDEEDIVAVVVGILAEQSREELLKLVKDMDEEELFHMVAYYMIEVMKRKIAMEDEGLEDPEGSLPTIH
ncbi:DUF6154 family protein [Brevibacillus ginsengisoli]|uniref:DUF6154 family protein n=1 Tax=Brevibacillus ginsengisoli TaxID=363854 RepID=UPI003CEE1746